MKLTDHHSLQDAKVIMLYAMFEIFTFFYKGVLIFNPLSFAILSWIGWKLTFGAFAVVLLVIGVPLALTFRKPRPAQDVPRHGLDTISEESESHVTPEGDAISREGGARNADVNVDTEGGRYPVATRTKVIISSLWLFTSLLKSWAYFTPYIVLVSQNMNSHVYFVQ